MRGCMMNRQAKSAPAHRVWFVAVMTILVVTFVLDKPAYSARLTWRLNVGQKMSITLERTLRQSVADTEWTETINYTLTWVVDAVDEVGNMTMQQMLTSVRHVLSFPGDVDITYDSSVEGEVKGDAAILAKYWVPFLNVNRQVILQPNGKLTIVSADDLTRKPPVATPSAIPEVQDWSDVPQALVDQTWSLPERDLVLNEEWSTIKNLPWKDQENALELTTKYRYVGPSTLDEKSVEKIDVVMQWQDVTTPASTERVMIDRQAGGGGLYFDTSAGYLVASDRTQDLTVRITRPDRTGQTVDLATSLKMQVQPMASETPERTEP